MKKRLLIFFLSIAICISAFSNIFTINVHAENNENLIVSQKENTAFFTDTPIAVDQFNIMLNNKSVETSLISVSPEHFTQPGTQTVTFTYFATDNSIYKTSLLVDVVQLEDTELFASDNKITLIRDQQIELSELPTIYAITNSGSRRVVTDYSYTMDWNNSILTITYKNLSCKIEVTVIDNSLEEITATLNKTTIEEDYSFSKSDFEVYAHYKNGTTQKITDYTIQPYTLKADSDSLITITYATCSCMVKIHVAAKNTSTNAPITTPNTTETPTITSKLSFYDLSADTGSIYYTNRSIKIVCNNISNGKYQIVNSNADISNSNWINFESEIEINKSSSNIRKLYIQYTSADGKITYKKSKSFLLDTVAPSCNVSKKIYTKNITITCSDSNSAISKITLSGKKIKNNYTLKKEGTYILKVTDLCGNTYTTNFTLKKPARKLSVSYKAISSKVIKFSAKVTGTTRSVTWSVSNSKMASISKSGKFVAIHKGTCYVTARIDKLKIRKKIVIQENKNTTSAYVY